MDDRKFWEKKTTWGVLALFLAGGLEAIGVSGAMVTLQQLAGVIGFPLTAYGIADRIKK